MGLVWDAPGDCGTGTTSMLVKVLLELTWWRCEETRHGSSRPNIRACEALSAATHRRFFTPQLVSAFELTATSCGEGKWRQVAALQTHCRDGHDEEPLARRHKADTLFPRERVSSLGVTPIGRWPGLGLRSPSRLAGWQRRRRKLKYCFMFGLGPRFA
jgi:hypothetical protein